MVPETVQRHRRVTAAIFGVILISLGAIFILDNLGRRSGGWRPPSIRTGSCGSTVLTC